ncbi:MAG: fructose-6-phosphate aldolase [Candidatus Cloacimonadota bacterium]|nr:MAG: fructose-6-phosphate aldolase [Candidatus Cloacimonadota bacterium]
MKIFIDTANLDEIKEASELRLLDGVTTNPTLLSREVERTGMKPDDVLKRICEMVDGPISAEVVSLEAEGIVKEAKELGTIAKNICIKIPIVKDGIKATRRLREMGIMVNMTLIFSVNQALLAAKAGATFVSPFIGRLDDIGHTGMDIIRDIMTVFENYDFTTEVIVASIRHPLHVVEAALIGADIATIPFKVIDKMFKHPLTDIGIERFLADWKKISKK